MIPVLTRAGVFGIARTIAKSRPAHDSKLEIGMPMELVFDKFMEDEEGNDIISFSFAPLTGD